MVSSRLPSLPLARWISFSAALLGLASCQRKLPPEDYLAERAIHEQAGSGYLLPWSDSALPDLHAEAALDQVLEHAFVSSGELEAAYLDWRGAIERIPQAGALPDPRIDFQLLFMPDFFPSGASGAFGGIARSLIEGVRLMAEQELPAKGKREAGAQGALAEARAAAERFRAVKWRLQRASTQSYARLALSRELIENTSDTLRLLGQTRAIALQHYHSIQMETAADIQKTELEIDRVADQQQSLWAEEKTILAELNGLLNRPAEAPIGSVRLPEADGSALEPARLLSLAVDQNPELAALRREIEAKGAAQVLAELQRKPDLMIGGGLDDPLVPILTLGATVPLNHERIRASIAEAIAAREAEEARLRQSEFDLRGRLAAALARISDSERAASVAQGKLIPKAEQILASQKLQYGSGAGSYMELLDTQRTIVELRRLAIEARANRILHLAEIEEIAAADLIGAPERGAAGAKQP